MAGGFGQKPNSKNKSFIKNGSNSEVFKDLPTTSTEKKVNNSGILFPGQSVELSKPQTESINWNKEFLFKSIQVEQQSIVNRQSEELVSAINEIRLEIKKLINVTENLDQEIVNIPLEENSENNQYQLNFLFRIKRLIENFRKNISDAGVWMESFTHKKSRRNAFWGKARNKKNGGEQYLLSGEHSASRSAN
ncbi:MAG: DUF5660 family protein [Candidatus Shapirobacteria bacterium]